MIYFHLFQYNYSFFSSQWKNPTKLIALLNEQRIENFLGIKKKS